MEKENQFDMKVMENSVMAHVASPSVFLYINFK